MMIGSNSEQNPHYFPLLLRGSRLQINIPDTIVFKQGRPISWLFTASDGLVYTKHKKNISVRAILARFGQISKQNKNTYVCVSRSKIENNRIRIEFLLPHQLLTLLENKTALTKVLTLQTFTAYDDQKPTYISTYTLCGDGLLHKFSTNRLSNNMTISGKKKFHEQEYEQQLAKFLPQKSKLKKAYIKGDESKLTSNRIVNEELETLTLSIVRFIEREQNATVSTLQAEFIRPSNYNRKPVLTHISNVQYRQSLSKTNAATVIKGKKEMLKMSSKLDIAPSKDRYDEKSNEDNRENIKTRLLLAREEYSCENKSRKLVKIPISLQKQRINQARYKQEKSSSIVMDPAIRVLFSGPGRSRSSEINCWGEFCEAEWTNRKQEDCEYEPYYPRADKSVALLSILMASVENVYANRTSHSNRPLDFDIICENVHAIPPSMQADRKRRTAISTTDKDKNKRNAKALVYEQDDDGYFASLTKEKYETKSKVNQSKEKAKPSEVADVPTKNSAVSKDETVYRSKKTLSLKQLNVRKHSLYQKLSTKFQSDHEEPPPLVSVRWNNVNY